jgi:hypothetical protein
MPHRLSSTALVFGGEFITSNRINKVIVCFFLTLHLLLYTSNPVKLVSVVIYLLHTILSYSDTSSAIYTITIASIVTS